MSNNCDVASLDLEIALVDFEMPVGNTGIIFVAALEARMASWGPVFSTVATLAAYRRAASTLAQMALVAGSTFEFMRLAVPYSQSEAAAFLGVSQADVSGWEAGGSVIPTNLWYLLADKICDIDGREFCPFPTLPDLSFRPRRVRVYPDIPRIKPSPTGGSDCDCDSDC